MLIQEDWQQKTDDGHVYGSGDSGVFEPFTDNIGKLFLALQREHGKCTSKVYIDTPEGAKAIGWTFEKLKKYDDCNEYFTALTWVTLHDAQPVKSTKYNYHYLN